MIGDNCWSRFVVKSRGSYNSTMGYISDSEFVFDPNDITQILGVNPDVVCEYGKQKRGLSKSSSVYMFSGWYGLKIQEPPLDRSKHLQMIIEALSPSKEKLIEFKERYNPIYEIELSIYSGSNSDISISQDELSFLMDVGIELRIITLLM